MVSLTNDSTNQEGVLSPICEATIRDCLVRQGASNIGSIEVFSSLSSTNDYLLHKEIGDKKEITICIAERQTQGRGRFGHTWWSPPGNLYLSLLYPLEKWDRKYETLGLWLLIAVAKLLKRLKCVGVQLKWPNDICVQGRKLGGILIERKSGRIGQRLVIGVGLNVTMSTTIDAQPEAFWSDLISIMPGWSLSRNELAAHLIISCSTTLADLKDNALTGLPSTWNRYDAIRDRSIQFTCNRKCSVGIARGVDEQGRIIVELNGKAQHLHNAHVSEIKL